MKIVSKEEMRYPCWNCGKSADFYLQIRTGDNPGDTVEICLDCINKAKDDLEKAKGMCPKVERDELLDNLISVVQQIVDHSNGGVTHEARLKGCIMVAESVLYKLNAISSRKG